MTRVTVLFAAALLTAGCSTTGGTPSPAPTTSASSPAGEPHRLAFAVTGTAVITTLTCTIDGKATEEKNVKLPWNRTFTFPPHTGKHTYDVVLKYTNGDVSATATIDGQPWGSSRGSGDGPSTLSLNGDFSD
jgi:hypothetical protein